MLYQRAYQKIESKGNFTTKIPLLIIRRGICQTELKGQTVNFKMYCRYNQNKMRDPRISPMLYVSEVNVTPDFKFCKIKIAIDDTEYNVKKTIEVLQKSEGFIKRQLAEAVQMPQVPKLKFEIDKGTSATIRINEILKNLDIPKEEE